MRKYIFSSFVLVLFPGLSAYGAIYSLEQRKQMIEDGRRVLEREVVFVDEDLANRLAIAFGDMTGVVEEEEEAPTEVSPDRLIYELANQIDPTGVFSVNGDYYLILKEKRIKSGSYMPVRYLGREYSVLLSKVVRNAFTIRMGEQELEIKFK